MHDNTYLNRFEFGYAIGAASGSHGQPLSWPQPLPSPAPPSFVEVAVMGTVVATVKNMVLMRLDDV